MFGSQNPPSSSGFFRNETIFRSECFGVFMISFRWPPLWSVVLQNRTSIVYPFDFESFLFGDSYRASPPALLERHSRGPRSCKAVGHAQGFDGRSILRSPPVTHRVSTLTQKVRPRTRCGVEIVSCSCVCPSQETWTRE